MGWEALTTSSFYREIFGLRFRVPHRIGVAHDAGIVRLKMCSSAWEEVA
jgi:hypothetical protein